MHITATVCRPRCTTIRGLLTVSIHESPLTLFPGAAWPYGLRTRRGGGYVDERRVPIVQLFGSFTMLAVGPRAGRLIPPDTPSTQHGATVAVAGQPAEACSREAVGPSPNSSL
jgi:hypothetical protein